MHSQLSPPGATEAVHARSVLVLAPHFDDEVLGCGGLVVQLVAAGAVVRVLFLSDSSGGIEDVEDRQAYRERRAEEAREAVRILGVAGFDRVDLPDGRLADHQGEMADAIRRAVLSQRPDLVLVTSPMEASPDHRAAFQALHRFLQTEEPDLAQVLLYEGNQPFYPDLLVDVTAEVPAVEKAMAAYASQEERHPYLQARHGLWRLRTLTLDAEVTGTKGPTQAVEAYRRLAVDDFVTRSPAQLIAHLGGSPELLEVREGATFSVVVRTRDRPELLAEALASLAASTYRRWEAVVVNDGGTTPELPDDFPVELHLVDLEENLGRSAAMNAGIAAATGNYVTFLDDDDLVAPEHLATLAGLVSGAGVRVAYTDAAVGVYELGDGGWQEVERRLPYSRDFDGDLLLFDNYIPSNTLAIDRQLLDEVTADDGTVVDEELPFFEDWDLLIRLAAKTPFHHLARVTCEYRHFRDAGHHVLAGDPRQRADFLDVKARVLEKHAGRRTAEVTARVVDRLRAEAVHEGENARAARRELDATAGEVDALRLHTRVLEESQARLGEETARLHRREGELVAELRQQAKESRHWIAEWEGRAKALEEELAEVRSYGEARLAAAQAEHGDTAEKLRLMTEQEDRVATELRGAYAEIERLNALVKTMEGTRAWRVHQWIQAKRGR